MKKFCGKFFAKKKSLTWSASRPHRLPAARCGILRGVSRSATAEIRGRRSGKVRGPGRPGNPPSPLKTTARTSLGGGAPVSASIAGERGRERWMDVPVARRPLRHQPAGPLRRSPGEIQRPEAARMGRSEKEERETVNGKGEEAWRNIA